MKTLAHFGLAFGVAAVLSVVTLPVRGAVYHDNVVIVLDASGSMGDAMPGTRMEKMTAAKQALKTVLQQVPETTYIGLLVFGDVPSGDSWVYPLGPRDDAALARAVELPRPGGGTPLGRFMKIAADRLLAEREKQFGYGTYRLLIVTDGKANDNALVERYTPDILARGVTVDVIGVAMREDHTLATKAHSYRRADNAESLRQAVAEVLAEVSRPQDDTASAEAFELLAPIPIEVAAAAIEALSVSGNAPIGERATAARVNESAPVAARSAQPGSPSSAPVASPAKRFPRLIMWVVVLAIVVGVLRSIGGRRRR